MSRRPRILTPSIRPCGPTQDKPFDTALRAYSGQAVDLQEATSEPSIRVAGYCLVINQWHLASWPRGDLSACPPACPGAGRHRQVDSARMSCCGLREKTALNFCVFILSVFPLFSLMPHAFPLVRFFRLTL
jgi:hypothetical protein